jgi:hypothetical protein
MLLPSAQAVNKMFEKKGFVLPIIWWGIWRIGTLGKFTKLTEFIEKYLRPTDEMLKDPKIKAFCVRMQLMVAAYGLKAVGEHDEHCTDVVMRAPNGAMEIRVAPDGPVVHIMKEGGTITPVKGPAKDPMVIMQINGMDLAYDMLNGNVDFMEALGLCKIQLFGHIGMAEDMALVLESIAKYIE